MRLRKKSMPKGKQLEAYLREVHRHYKLQRRAYMQKAPDPVNITGRRGSKVWGVISKSYFPDFFGYVIHKPYPIFVGGEAKECSHERRFSLSRIEQSQAETLGQIHKDGGIAWVWIRNLRGDDGFVDYLLPWIHISKWIQEGHKSATWNDMIPWRVPPGLGWIDAAVQRQDVTWSTFCELGWEILNQRTSRS